MPINRATVSADDYEDTKPTKTNLKSAEFEEEDENETPKIGTSIQSGWDAASSFLKSEKSKEYTTDLRIGEEPQLLKFLSDAPFAVYQQHWITRQGKQSFVCLNSLTDERGDDGCPLCDLLGDKPRPKFAFAVLNFNHEDGPTVQVLTASSTLLRMLKAANDDDRKGPITKHYWEIARQGTGPKTTYILDMVRERDLAEEFDLDPAEAQKYIAASKTKMPNESEIYVTPFSELKDIAKSLL